MAVAGPQLALPVAKRVADRRGAELPASTVGVLLGAGLLTVLPLLSLLR